jgi:uroporphyrinogen-III decarboxylase
MRMDAVDPLEPPPQGDVSLDEARRAVGDDVVLFGNIELNLLETLSPEEFSVLVRRTVEQGRAAGGRGFVLMPTAAPCGREVSARTLENYRVLVDTALGIRH